MADWLKKMPIYYSRSDHIERAVKLFLNSLIVSGHKDTAIFYSRVFKRQFPSLDVDGKINVLLRDFEKSTQEKNATKELPPTSSKSEIPPVEIMDETPIVTIDANNASGPYSLQTGAYSVMENAESQKINLIIAGFSARINKLYKSNRTLYAVRIGHYDKREDAQKVGAEIKAKFGIKTVIITNN